MKVYITKYALTKGIIEADAEIVGGKYAKTRSAYGIFTTEWSKTPADAARVADAMRSKKIASLKKQIAKLEGMRFVAGYQQAVQK